MATIERRMQRIRYGAEQIDAAILKASEGLTPQEVAQKRKVIFGKPASKPVYGDRVLATDLFEGTPFYGVPAQVTTDPALAASGVKWSDRRVMVRFEKPIIGRRQFFGFPVEALAVVTE